MKLNNPFIVYDYEGPEYFCDRKSETKRIINALENKRNLTLMSLRRMGKTGLIKHVFQKLNRRRNTKCIYVNILPTYDLDSFVKTFGLSVVEQSMSFGKKSLLLIQSLFSGLNLNVEFDNKTGNPSFTILPGKQKDYFTTIDKIFDYIKSQNTSFYIAFDEFQQINNYSGGSLVALLRTHVQSIKNASFIFSGSEKHMLISMFADHSQPFYQSTEIMDLKKIDEKVYRKFIVDNFEKGKTKITIDALDYIFEKTHGHTFYVQKLCNMIFANAERKIDRTSAEKQFNQILKETEFVYYNHKKLLTNFQWKLLGAIASEEEIERPMGKEFISKYNLGTASSIARTLQSLQTKEYVYSDMHNIYKLSDIFFSEWLKMNVIIS